MSGSENIEQPPVICLNLCDKDVQAGMAQLDWMMELDGQIPCECIIARDVSSNRIISNLFIEKAKTAFDGVSVFDYQRPVHATWPEVCNEVWITVARVMEEQRRAWFWMESDVTALRPGWADVLFMEYSKALSLGKPIMGPVIPGRGHVNGTSVYPWNTPEILPRCMRATSTAWDWLTDEARHLIHDCTHIFQHVWSIENNAPSFHGGSGSPDFRTAQNVKDWVNPSAYLFHRCKNMTLIHRLREMRNQNKLVASVGGRGGGGGVLKL